MGRLKKHEPASLIARQLSQDSPDAWHAEKNGAQLVPETRNLHPAAPLYRS